MRNCYDVSINHRKDILFQNISREIKIRYTNDCISCDVFYFCLQLLFRLRGKRGAFPKIPSLSGHVQIPSPEQMVMVGVLMERINPM
jgi:hypothetical protein